MTTVRLAALVSHPIQYQAPLFRQIAAKSDVDLTVYFCSRQGVDAVVDEGFGQEVIWDVPLLNGYEHEFLRDWSPRGESGSFFRFNPGVISCVRSDRHDVLWVHGYGTATNWLAFGAASVTGLPTVLRGESTLLNMDDLSGRMKRVVLARLFSAIDAFGYIGERNKQFYESFGIEHERLFRAPYTVNNEFFRQQRRELPSRETIREQFGFPTDRPVVLFVGKLIERKRPSLLLQAFCRVTDPDEALLLYVGDGEQYDSLRSQARRRDRESDIELAGFVNQSDLPKYYKLSDVFVLPSVQENWGLVVNEAMNFGLPVLTTEAVGSSTDLVDERNGGVCPVDDVESLADALSELVGDPELRSEMGAVSQRRIDGWGIPETADGIVRAAQYAAN